jgi:hypothetical protein
MLIQLYSNSLSSSGVLLCLYICMYVCSLCLVSGPSKS